MKRFKALAYVVPSMDIFTNPMVMESFKGNVLANLLSSYPSLLMVALFLYRVICALQELDMDTWHDAWLSTTYRRRCTAHIEIHGTSARRSNTWVSSSTSVIPHSLKALTRYALQKCPYGLRNLTEDFTGHVEVDCYNDDDNKETIKNSSAIMKYIPAVNTNFRLTEHVWMRTRMRTERTDNDTPMTVDNYTVELSSYTLTPTQLCTFINKITDDYLREVAEARKGKKYIYRLRSFDDGTPVWSETQFESNRTFDNLHFDGKTEFLSQIQAFTDGEEWYKSHGHAYACGIALHGPPGTGKTSMIKALANLTNRHIVEIPLSKISSEDELFDAYFCEKYNRKTGEVLSFRDKIICFEDIDCQQHLLARDPDDTGSDVSDFSNMSVNGPMNLPTDPVELKKAAEALVANSKPKPSITLDTMLNLLDGIRENTGRMLIFTTNHYDKLDPAFTRPGRVDIEKEMGRVGVHTIQQIFTAHTGEILHDSELEHLKDAKFAPCEIVKAIKTCPSAASFIKYLGGAKD